MSNSSKGNTPITEWLNSLSNSLLTAQPPQSDKNFDSVKDVTYHDFATYLFVLDPWADRRADGAESPPETEGGTSAGSDPLEDIVIASLSEYAEFVVGQFLAELSQQADDPEAFDIEPVVQLLRRFITTCSDELDGIYSPDLVPLRRDNMVILLLDNVLPDLVDDRFELMDDNQRSRFLEHFDTATREWVRRAAMFDRPWTAPEPLIDPIVIDDNSMRTPGGWNGYTGYSVIQGFQDVPYLRYELDENNDLTWIPRNRGENAAALSFNNTMMDAPPMEGSQLAPGTSTTQFKEALSLSVSFVRYTGGNPFLRVGVENLLQIADGIVAEQPTVQDVEAEEVVEYLAAIRDQLSVGLFASVGGSAETSATEYRDRYGFRPYPSGTINLGFQILYRQEWELQDLTKGDLVRTIPLGPGQSEKVVFRQQVRDKVSREMVDSTVTETMRESSLKLTNSSEVVEEAARLSKWDVRHDGEVSAVIKVVNIKGSHSLGYQNQSSQSSRGTKKRLSEAMQRASVKLRRENRVTVNTERETIIEETRTSEISNPNDAIAVTYYFYTLQQQYKVYTYLASVEPVIFIAEALPTPADLVDMRWYRRYDWILSRVLLDDSFADILARLASLDLELMIRELELAIAEVEQLRDSLRAANTSLGNLHSLQGDVATTYEGTLRAFQDAISSARELGREYQDIISQANRLADHIADNILYYYRAIWSYEDPERRRMRYADYEWPTIFTREFYTAPSDDPLDASQGLYGGIFQPEQGSEEPLSDLIDPTGPVAYAGNYAVFRILNTEETAGWTRIIRQAAQPYYKPQTLRLINAPAGEAVVFNHKLYAGEEYDFQIAVTTQTSATDPLSQLNIQVTRRYAGSQESVREESIDTSLDENNMLVITLLYDGVRVVLSSVPTAEVAFEIKPNELEIQDPELTYLESQYPGDRAAAERALADNNTRLILVDTNNLVLEIDPSPLLEPFKQYHRMLDVALVATEVERRNRRLVEGLYGDPEVEKVVVSTDGNLAAHLAAEEAGTISEDAESDA